MNHLQEIQEREKLVRVRVREVARGRVPSFFIYGPGGHAKSHMITDELNKTVGEDKWLHHNSHMTHAGLRKVLEDAPDTVHFLEDMEPLFAGRVGTPRMNAGLEGLGGTSLSLRRACDGALGGEVELLSAQEHGDGLGMG